MNTMNQQANEEMDTEWIYLIITARNMGLNKEDIRAFLNNPTVYETTCRLDDSVSIY